MERRGLARATGAALAAWSVCACLGDAPRTTPQVGGREYGVLEAAAPRAESVRHPSRRAQAVELALMRRRVASGSLPEPEVQEKAWTLHEPERPSSSYTLVWRERSRGVRLERATIRGARNSALVTYAGASHRDFTLRQLVIEPAPGFRTWWGIRVHEIDDWLLDRVEIRYMGGPSDKPEGHALYANVAGDLTLDTCWFHHNKGQAVQVVARPATGTAPATGVLTIRDCLFSENGFDSDRAGFAVSVFGPGGNYDVVIEDTRIEALTLPPYEGPGERVYYSMGGVCIAPVQGKQGQPVWFDEEHPPYTNGRVSIDGLEVEMRRPYQPLAQFKGIRELRVRNSTFQGGVVVIDEPDRPGRDCGVVTWVGNKGDARLFWRGEEIGPVDRNYTFGAAR